MSNELTIKQEGTVAHSGDIFANAGQMLQLADAIKNSSFVPAAMRGDPGNAFLAIELANRAGLPLMATLQGMYVIEGKDGRSTGKPAFYANFVHALIRKSGVYSETYYEEGEDGKFDGQPNKTCRLVAVRNDGTTVKGPVISLAMAAKAGWSKRNAQMWDAYTQTMLQNRAVTFFARQCCPDLIYGLEPDGDLRPLDDEPIRVRAERPEETVAPRVRAIVETEVFKDAEVIEPEDEGVNYSDAAEVMRQTIEKPKAKDGEWTADDLYTWYAEKIVNSKTTKELETHGKAIKGLNLPKNLLDQLRELYLQQKDKVKVSRAIG